MFSSILYSLLMLELVILSSAGVIAEANENHESTEDDTNLNDSEKQQLFLKLERLAKTNKNAYVIWNISKKHDTLDRDRINDTCVAESEKNNELVPFYLVKLTLQESERLIYIYRNYWQHKKIKDGSQVVYDNRSKIISDQEIYLSVVDNMIAGFSDGEDGNICVSNSSCGCILKTQIEYYKSKFAEYKEHTQILRRYLILKKIVEPLFRTMIVIIGLVLNSTVLFIFIKEKSVRTESNVLILNLAISNIIMLIVYIPSNYMNKFENTIEGHEFTAIEVFVVSANALTILFVNIQRYFEVSRVLNNNVQCCVSSPAYRCVIYLVVLWFWSTVVAIFLGLIDYTFGLILEMLIYFFVYLFIFSIVLSVFNSMTARKLHRAVKEGKSCAEFQHIIGSGVVLCLTIVYYSTHIPFYIYRVFESAINFTTSDIFMPTTFRVIIFLLHLVFFSYPCINVIVLYKASSTYRNFFNKYLFRCWYNPGESKYVTMSSVRNIEQED